MTAKTVRSRKSKGRNFQKQIVKLIQEYLQIENGDIKPIPSSIQGEDIWLGEKARQKFPFSVECKRTEKLDLWSALEQCETNSGKFNPLLVFKRNRGKIYCCLNFEQFLYIYTSLNQYIKYNNDLEISNKELERKIEDLLQELQQRI